MCCARGIKGTLLLAREGVNGTVAGDVEAIATLIAWLEAIPELTGLDVKYSSAAAMPFHRMKVKLKREIVTMGVDWVDPLANAGTYVEPASWNALIADPDTVVIDTRNDYEYKIGTFKNAINPQTSSFNELPEFIEKNLDPEKHKKVAMFCTGGIRCEKFAPYLKTLGFEEVYQLEGGILRYLEEIPENESLWQGECFVFDERISLDEKLEKGSETDFSVSSKKVLEK